MRRKSPEHHWIDCYGSFDNGLSWSLLSKVADTEADGEFNGNPPALIALKDGRLACGYFWCTQERPRRHIECTVFEPPPVPEREFR